MPSTTFNQPIYPGAKVITVETTVTNTSGSYTGTITDSRIASTMKAIHMEVGTPSVFGSKVTATCNNGSLTIACDSVAGTSTVKFSLLKTDDDPTAITSTEYDELNNSKVSKVDSPTTGNIAILDSNGGIADGEKDLDDLVPVSAVANNLTTATEGYVLDARQGKALDEQIGTLNSKLTTQNVTYEYDATNVTEESNSTFIKKMASLVTVNLSFASKVTNSGAKKIIHIPYKISGNVYVCAVNTTDMLSVKGYATGSGNGTDVYLFNLVSGKSYVANFVYPLL